MFTSWLAALCGFGLALLVCAALILAVATVAGPLMVLWQAAMYWLVAS
jgi:hypothetical protein